MYNYKTDNRILWLDSLRGFGIILVLLGHIYYNTYSYNWIYTFHMHLFFFAGGWLYKKTDIVTHITHKLYTLIIPYFSMGTITLIYWYLIERPYRSISMSLPEGILGLIQGEYDSLSFNVPLWFIPCFFLTSVLYNICTNIAGENATYVISIILSATYLIFEIPELPWGINRISAYIGFFALGHMLNNTDADKKLLNIKPHFQLTLIFLLLVSSIYLSLHTYEYKCFWFINGIVGLSAFIMISLLLTDKLKPINYLSHITLPVLCLHGPIYRAILGLFSHISNQSTNIIREQLIFVIPTIIITIFICMLLNYLFVRYTPWIVGKKKTKT